MEVSREIRLLISKYGFKPKDRLGQNFLIARSGLENISSVIAPSKDKTYVEVGAGFLNLTRIVAEGARKVIAIEKDKSFMQFYDDYLKASPLTNIEVLLCDALDFNFSEVNANELFGNIPYNISSELLVKISKENKIERCVLLLQKEFAERILALPGTKQYGSITVLVDMYFNKKFHKNFPNSFFFPRPEVSSTLIELKRRNQYYPEDEAIINFVRASFAERRKTLLNNLKKKYPSISVTSAIKQLKLGEKVRAEDLSFLDFIMLFKLISEI